MKNTMNKGEYLFEHILWGFILILWCKRLLFRCIPNFTYKESLLMILGIGFVVMGISIFLTWNIGRNYVNLAKNLLLLSSIFVVLSYEDILKNKIHVIGYIVSVVSFIMSAIIVLRTIKRKRTKQLNIKKIGRNILNIWRCNLAIASLFLMIPLGTSIVLNDTILNANVNVSKIYGDEHCLAANLDTICNINPERWEKLNIQEKLNVCQKIVNCEARYLGLSHEILVGTAELYEGMYGYYSNNQHQIVVDLEHLTYSHPYDVLTTLLHECQHAYQHAQMDLYQKLDEESRNLLMFYEVSVYLEEFSDYKNGIDDFENYYYQLMEINARQAASEESKEYIQRVDEYLSEKAESSVQDQ